MIHTLITGGVQSDPAAINRTYAINSTYAAINSTYVIHALITGGVQSDPAAINRTCP